jgi:hypothetical protein
MINQLSNQIDVFLWMFNIKIKNSLGMKKRSGLSYPMQMKKMI